MFAIYAIGQHEIGGGNPAFPYAQHSLERGRENNMDRLLTLNGKSYKAAEFDLNLICDFEDRGISLDEIGNKMFNVIRQYVASSMDADVKTAGTAISEHLKNGGSLEDISDVMSAAMEDSGFFRSTSENKNPSGTARTRKKKSENEEVTS